MTQGKKGEPCYSVKPELRGRLAGYLRNISLAKILLTNQRWPFILGTRLHADITVGIDVKQNTTGFVIIGHNGDNIRSLLKTSRQKEKLDEQHMKSWLGEIIRQEASDRSTPIETIVIHRDGKAYPPEIKGACQAIEMLQKEGVIANNTTLTILEIPKTSPAPLRLFDVGEKNGQRWVENPQLGNYVVVSNTEGYICSTGRAFRRPGTVNPLHIRRVYGCLPIEDCLEDVFYLTALAWTRPEDCTRYPITLKLNDRFLSEDATDYDPDDLDIVDSPEESDE